MLGRYIKWGGEGGGVKVSLFRHQWCKVAWISHGLDMQVNNMQGEYTRGMVLKVSTAL